MNKKEAQGEELVNNQNVRPHNTPAEALEKSMKEMMQIRKGELPKRSVFDLLDEVDE